MHVTRLATALLLLACASAAQAQMLTVQGKGVERGSRDPVPAANVQIAGMREVLTGRPGRS